MKLFLVRHGETTHNLTGLIQGWSAGELTARGRRQAEKLADELRTFGIEAVFCSDLLRAVQTAEIVSRNLAVPVFTDWLLRERQFGRMEGMSVGEIDWDWLNSSGKDELELLGVETLAQTDERARVFVQSLRYHPGGLQSVAVVSHGGFLNAFLRCLWPRCAFHDFGNTEVMYLEVYPEDLCWQPLTNRLDILEVPDKAEITDG